MSSSSSSPSTVSLYRYDLTQGMARSMGPMLIGRALEGIWHTSIVVFGKEYYFDGGVGIAADPNPGRTRFGQPYRTEVLGQTRKRHEEFFAWTQQQRSSGFGPNDYHLLNNNCNSFSDAASMFLLGRHIPQDVLEMIPTLLATPMGQMLRPMLEQATSGNPAGINAAPRAALPQPPPPPPATSAAQRTDTCVGLLSPHKSITEDDEEELMLAQAMLESNETIADGPRSSPDAFEKAISGLTLLQTVMGNICAHPTEAKYRALSMESNAYKTKLKPLEPYGVTDVLRIAGFVRRPHSSGGSGEQWYLSDAAGSAELLERVSEMLAMTISSIEGAAADAAKARATLAAGPTISASQPANENAEGANSLKSPPSPDGSPDAAAHTSNFTSGNAGAASTVLRYCYPPFDKDWRPLSVGSEGGAPLFSIHCLPGGGGQDGVGAAGPLCFGKCRLSPNQQHLQAYYCSGDGLEVEVRGGYEVLCVHRGQEDSLVWVPARMACAATSATPSRFIFSGYGRFGVARAEHGSGVQPGVMEPSGRCVIPYGGRAVVVTEKAEVLCERARLPASLAQALAELEKGVHLSQVLRAANGQPIGSFDELLHRWQPPTFYIPPAPLQPRTRQPASVVNCDGDGRRDSAVDDEASPSSTTSPFARGTASSVRLLVCHDFGGGYTAGERPAFVLEESGEAREERKTRTEATPMHKRNALVESAYTVGYWDRTDCFVYFSHQRISVPPRSWIHDGHRHGVTVLGTLITEGAGGVADLELLLTDAKRMALIIERLVQVCDVYGFDGYLVNIENKLPTNLAKRLLVFCTQLRKQLNCRASQRTARLVIWYDAVTTDGTLAYQNALTARNKPFFDVCDGLFTNYFWNPVHIAMTRAAAGSRGADVFVGVDVFGRRMFGGGGYNSYLAVEEAVHADLSVALFAPGWTMESESHGSRDGFEQAESRLWSRMQDKFPYRTRLLSCTVPENGAASTKSGDHYDDGAVHAWTAFQSGVGYHFYVNGHRITSPPGSSQQAGKSVTTSAWCDISASHASPPFLYEASSSSPSGAHTDPVLPARGSAATSLGPFAPVSIRLPASSLEGSMYGCTARAEWLYDKAWFGDRCLGIVLPPKEAAEVLRWNVRNALPPARDGASAPDLSSPARSSALHIEVVVDDAAVAASAGASAVESGRAVREPVGAQQGLRLGLYSASRGAFFATVWEKTAQAGTTAATVAGLDGVQVFVRVLSGSSVRSDRADTSKVVSDHPAGDGWHRVHYELLNTSSETVHLTSISIANGDRSRTLRLCIGAIAVYQAPPQMNTMHNEEGTTAEASMLRAGGPRVWKTHATHFTGRGGEHVLALHDAEAVFAEVRAQYGTSSTVVLFASVSALAADCRSTHSEEEEKSTAHVTPLDPVHEGGHHMYIGQYSVNPADKTTFNDALLVPLSLPAERVVTQVFYYTVPNGY